MLHTPGEENVAAAHMRKSSGSSGEIGKETSIAHVPADCLLSPDTWGNPSAGASTSPSHTHALIMYDICVPLFDLLRAV